MLAQCACWRVRLGTCCLVWEGTGRWRTALDAFEHKHSLTLPLLLTLSQFLLHRTCPLGDWWKPKRPAPWSGWGHTLQVSYSRMKLRRPFRNLRLFPRCRMKDQFLLLFLPANTHNYQFWKWMIQTPTRRTLKGKGSWKLRRDKEKKNVLKTTKEKQFITYRGNTDLNDSAFFHLNSWGRKKQHIFLYINSNRG